MVILCDNWWCFLECSWRHPQRRHFVQKFVIFDDHVVVSWKWQKIGTQLQWKTCMMSRVICQMVTLSMNLSAHWRSFQALHTFFMVIISKSTGFSEINYSDQMWQVRFEFDLFLLFHKSNQQSWLLDSILVVIVNTGLINKEASNIADCDVCFCRLMSKLADVNIQSSDGMFNFMLLVHVLYVLLHTFYIKNKIIYFKCNHNGWNDTMRYKIKQQQK